MQQSETRTQTDETGKWAQEQTQGTGRTFPDFVDEETKLQEASETCSGTTFHKRLEKESKFASKFALFFIPHLLSRAQKLHSDSQALKN